MAKIIGDEIKNIPWQEPKDDSPIWRYDNNPIIDRNPIDNVARVFNSAVVKYQDKYVGIFRGDTRNITPYLYYGESKDGIHFKFNSERLRFYDDSGKEYKFEYAYDPRVVKVEDVYYIIWCDGIGGLPAIGLAKTLDLIAKPPSSNLSVYLFKNVKNLSTSMKRVIGMILSPSMASQTTVSCSAIRFLSLVINTSRS